MAEKTLVVCMGLPGSGKSTWACEQIAHSNGLVVRVTKDEIRKTLEQTGWRWTPDNEKDVIVRRDGLIGSEFERGAVVVISDDTNLARKHRVRLAQIAIKYGAKFEVKRFDTPIEECIRRDALREKSVGENVIRAMNAQYRWVPATEPSYEMFAKYESRSELPPAIICDLDGTLALNRGHRSFYDASTCDQDELNTAVAELVDAQAERGVETLLVSGREDKYREATERFLNKHAVGGLLHMRRTGDFRKDWVIKGEIFDEHIRNQYNVLFVLDDRDQVVKFWRYLGLTCFQVAEGTF